MNDANIATYDMHDPEMRLDSMAGLTDQTSQKRLAGHACYRLNTANQSIFDLEADRQVREDKGFYIPNFLTDRHYDASPEAYSLAAEHAKHLYKAQGLLGEALNLVGVLLASLGDEGDSRAMQFETGLKVIEKKLNKAHNRIDKHNMRHTNLFLAYFDLKGEANGGEPN